MSNYPSYVVGNPIKVTSNVFRPHHIEIFQCDSSNLYFAFNKKNNQYYPLSIPSNIDSGVVRR